jgi:hypothetical protein
MGFDEELRAQGWFGE